MGASGLNMSRRIRRTPFTDRVEAHGVRGFSVVNHMILPKAFQPPVEEDYWHLREHVQLWDVSCQRQVEIAGPDAARLVQWMTPRDISTARVGQCLYVPLVDETGGMINDPVLLKLAEDRYWLSIADSDVLLWAKGLALGAGMEVSVREPDVSPLAVQGPKADDVLAPLFGENVRDLGFFQFAWFEFKSTQQIIARSGYSRQGGFEIYLEGAHLGAALWDAVWAAGEVHNIRPGCPNLIERIEGGLLSYGNEMTREDTPLECGLERYCDLDGDVDFLGKDALRKHRKEGHRRMIAGLVFDGGPCPPCNGLWPVMAEGVQAGNVTSAIYSPRLKQNVALAMLSCEFLDAGTQVMVHCGEGSIRAGAVTTLPME